MNTNLPDFDRRVYGRLRAHALSGAQNRRMADMLPRLRIDLDDPGLGTPASLFTTVPDGVWLEIGFGGGEHIAWQAQRNAGVGLIGAEPFINGVAKLLGHIESAGLDNIRIHDGDIGALLPALGAASLSRVFILFPDPWPKRRHHKRRVINGQMLRQLHRVMKPGAELRIASDIAGYIDWTLIHLRRHGGFTWLANGAQDWRARPEDWPATRYENKAERAGRKPVFLRFQRKP